MRVVHYAANDTLHAEPWCGAWGSMDTDWTGVADDADCVECRAGMRRDAPAATAPAPARRGALQRLGAALAGRTARDRAHVRPA